MLPGERGTHRLNQASILLGFSHAIDAVGGHAPECALEQRAQLMDADENCLIIIYLTLCHDQQFGIGKSIISIQPTRCAAVG